jgi:predicted lipoprotein with Yx(FWY)xxD motif
VNTTSSRALAPAGRLVVLTAAATLVLAGCSSSSKSPSSAATSAAPAGAAKAATVETHGGDLGTYLTDGTGRTLYLFASDSGGKSSCSAACTKFWPPLTATGAPTGSGGATSSMLATITRTDGSTQVTYDGHPLYYYAQDTKPGDIKGQGNTGLGAKWWVVSPAGQPITTAAGASSSAPSPSPSKSSSGGGWA